MKITFNVVRAAVLAAAVVVLGAPTKASAAVIAFDQIGAATGTVLNDGTDFFGTQIRFDQISFGTTIVYCDDTQTGAGGNGDCYLNFDTDTGEFEVIATAGLYTSTGALLPTLANDDPVTVLTGTGITFAGLAGTTSLVIEGTDTKLAELLEYFNIADEDWSFVNTEIRNPGGFPVGQTVNITSADIDNTSTPVPEPGLLALFGLGLAGIGRQLARRRK